MSGGLVKNVGWEGLVRRMEKLSLESYLAEPTECPWCGQELLPEGEKCEAEIKNREIVGAIRVLAARAAADPIAWMVALLIANNPAITDRDIAERAGIGKTKVNEARQRLRAICPELQELADGYGEAVKAQRRRRKREGSNRAVPPPLVGTLKGRVQDRFAQRSGYSPTQGAKILADNIGNGGPA